MLHLFFVLTSILSHQEFVVLCKQYNVKLTGKRLQHSVGKIFKCRQSLLEFARINRQLVNLKHIRPDEIEKNLIDIFTIQRNQQAQRFRRDTVYTDTRGRFAVVRAHADRDPAIHEPRHNLVAPRALRFVTMLRLSPSLSFSLVGWSTLPLLSRLD